MASRLALCLLSVLLATGGCLKCEHCSSADKVCSGEPQDCAPSQTACLILTSETRVGNEQKVGTFKGCTETKYCPPRTSSLSSAFGLRMRNAAKCCQRDLCNKGAVRLPRAQPRPNGLQCSACVSDSTECQPNDTVSCLGPENYCVYFAGSITTGTRNYTYAVRGCATKSTCYSKVGVYKLPGVFTDVVIKSECRVASKPDPKESTAAPATSPGPSPAAD